MSSLDQPIKSSRRRRHSGAEPASGRERAVVIGTSVLITYAFWSYGGRPAWALIGFSLLSLLVPILAITPPWGKPLEFLKSLFRSPVFWVGFFTIAYPLVQALNPSYSVDYEIGTIPKLEPIDYISWLPTSVDAPMRVGTPWRHVLMFGGIFMVLATLRVTLTRRKSWLTLLWVLTINCSLMAFVGTLVKLSGSKEMLWILNPINAGLFFGTFAYKNNAGGVMYMTTALAFTLYFYHARQTYLQNLRSGPHLLCLLLIALIVFPVYVTNSKSSMVITAVICLTCGAFWLIAKLIESRQHGEFKYFAIILVSGITVTSIVAGTLGREIVDTEHVQSLLTGLNDDLESISEDQINEAQRSNKRRFIALLAFSQMLQESPFFGVGAGCFEYFSRDYSSLYPDIHYYSFSAKESAWRTSHWRDAHSDWLEFPIEYGWIGTGLLLASLLIWIPRSLQFLKSPRIYLLTPWLGSCALIGHAIFEFQFQTPTVVMVFAFAWTSPWFLQNLKRG
ncbi:MAG: O-antigen ligase family protein [Verrucomicrobiota bacterium]